MSEEQVDDLAQLRVRVAELREAVGRLENEQSERTARRLVKVLDKGSKPATSAKFIAGSIMRVGGTVAEGGAASLTDTGEVLHVAILYDSIPATGTLLVARRLDNRWAGHYVNTAGGGGGGCSGLICVYFRTECPLTTDISTHLKFAEGATITKDGSPFATLVPPAACVAISAAGTYVVTPADDVDEGPQTLVISNPCTFHEVDFTRRVDPFGGYACFLTVAGCGIRVNQNVLITVAGGGSTTVPVCFLTEITLPGEGTWTLTAHNPSTRYVDGSVTVTVDRCNPGAFAEIDLGNAGWTVCVPWLGPWPLSKHFKADDGYTGVSGADLIWDGTTWSGSSGGTVPACPAQPCPAGGQDIFFEVAVGTILLSFVSWRRDVHQCPDPAGAGGGLFAGLDPSPATPDWDALTMTASYTWCGGNHPVTLTEVTS